MNVSIARVALPIAIEMLEHQHTIYCESSSVGRASAFQAEGREFESRLSLKKKATFNRVAFLYLYILQFTKRESRDQDQLLWMI